jgi:hypothetical protein
MEKIKNIRFLSLLVTILLLGSHVKNAHCGWYKTKWGMTIEEIRTVLSRNIIGTPKTGEDNSTTVNISDYTIGKYVFEVLLSFDDQKGLYRVLIRKKEWGAGENSERCFFFLEDAFKTKYGNPSNVEDNNYDSGIFNNREWILNDTIIELHYSYFKEIVAKGTKMVYIIYKSRISRDGDKL